ncbi:MAG: hypothetical protein ACYDH6_14950 [Acidimicrobiales bacterium]
MVRARSNRTAATLLFAVAVVVAACSSGGGTSNKGGATSGTTTPAASGAKAKDAADIPAGDPSQAAYTPTGTLIADAGFRPGTDSFGAENYGNDINGVPVANLTAGEMRKLFGDGVCVDLATGTCDLIPEAAAWMKDNNDSMSGGHCQGFAAGSLLLWDHKANPSDFGGATTPAIPIDGNAAIQHELAYAWSFQSLPSIYQSVIEGTPSEILDKLKESLHPNPTELYVLSIRKRDNTGGHAIVPYAVEDKGDGTHFNILVYDNNYPKVTRAVEVDRNANTWKYSAAINPSEPSALYEGDADTKTMRLRPTLQALGVQPCPFCTKVPASGGSALGSTGKARAVLAAYKAEVTSTTPTLDIHLEGSDSDHAHLLISNSAGQRVGWSGGKFINELPGAHIEYSDASQNWSETVEPDYTVPDAAYTITVDGTTLKTADDTAVTVVSNDYDLSVSNLRLSPGEMDTMTVAPGGASSSFKAGQPQQPSIDLGVSDTSADYTFTFSGAQQQAGETLTLGLPPESGNLMGIDHLGR